MMCATHITFVHTSKVSIKKQKYIYIWRSEAERQVKQITHTHTHSMDKGLMYVGMYVLCTHTHFHTFIHMMPLYSYYDSDIAFRAMGFFFTFTVYAIRTLYDDRHKICESRSEFATKYLKTKKKTHALNKPQQFFFPSNCSIR